MEDQDYILFDQYLQKELSKEAYANFEERLENDAAFKESFTIYKELSMHLKHKFEDDESANTFKTNLENISNNYFNDDNDTVEQKPKRVSFFKYAIAVAAILIIGATVFNKLSNPSFSDYNNYEIISLTVRGGDDGLLKEAEKAFNNKKFTEAKSLFNKILSKTPTNLELQLYKAICLIETNDYREADELLRKLSETNSVYKNKAKWYWALSKLKQKNNEACVKLLQQIPEDAEDYNRAQKLLNKLD